MTDEMHARNFDDPVYSREDMGIPERLRRDANNKAPFMLPPVRDLTEQALLDLAAAFNPSDSLQATSQDWVPPWASKS